MLAKSKYVLLVALQVTARMFVSKLAAFPAASYGSKDYNFTNI